ncbi:hypothetical protein Tco_0964345 [Tanacetum coccineum]
MNIVPLELLQVVVPGAKKPWGILLLKLGLRMYLNIPMIHCSQEKTKTTQANLIASLKRRVKKLEKKRSSRTHKLKRLYKVGLSAKVESFGYEEDLALKSVKPKVKGDVIEELSVLVSAASASTKVSAASASIKVSAAATTTATIPTPRKGIVITELVTPTITRSSQQPSQAKVQDKGKGKMVEPEPVKPTKKKVITLDKEIALNIQAEIDEEFTIEEKATLFKELLEQRRKHFAAKRAEEKRNKPPTKTQQKKTMITYLKNMEGWKHKDLKSKDFDSIKELFDKAFKRKVNEDKDIAELQSLMVVIPDEEEVAIDVVPLAIKEDLEDLYKLVKAKYESTRPVEDLDLIYMLVEKKYPLAPLTLSQMLEKKLQIDYESEMAYQLYKYQVYGRIVGIKSFLMLFGVTAALIDVNAAQSNPKLLLLEEVTTASTKVTTASRKVTTVSTKLMLLNELMLLVKKLVLLS